MGLVELIGVFGIVLGVAVRELVKLRRDAAAARRPAPPTSVQATPPDKSRPPAD